MNRRNDGSIVIGGREVVFGMLGLAAVALVVTLVALGIRALRNREAIAQATVTPSNVLSTATVGPQASATPTPLVLGTTPREPERTPTPEPEMFEHEVQAGETLSSIATLYGLQLQTLLTANDLTLDDVIQEGQTLIIPLPPSQGGTWHEVQAGETLTIIANRYGVDIEVIRTANGQTEEDVIWVGQRLRIPGVVGEATQAPDSLPTEAAITTFRVEDLPERPLMADWPRSMLEGDLTENYPLQFTQEGFTAHYQPGTYAGENLGQTLGLIDDGIGQIERALGVRFDGEIDVYVAGTLFAAPNGHLRGLSDSGPGRVFLLHDGTGTPADNAYFFTHELAHLVTRQTWGAPGTAFILSEGVATYAGRGQLESGGYMNYDDLCAGIYAAGLLPSMVEIENDWQAFLGHIRDPFNYFASACFVDYLIETYGLEAMQRLYTTSDYPTVTGRSLAYLDAEFQQLQEERAAGLDYNPDQLRTTGRDVANAYQFVFTNYDGGETMHNAYIAVDQARFNLWKGNFAAAQGWLRLVAEITGYTP